ncbi:hypothetical protein SGPA1_41290 [Streptomyces misionensis JCM 4497]
MSAPRNCCRRGLAPTRPAPRDPRRRRSLPRRPSGPATLARVTGERDGQSDAAGGHGRFGG